MPPVTRAHPAGKTRQSNRAIFDRALELVNTGMKRPQALRQAADEAGRDWESSKNSLSSGFSGFMRNRSGAAPRSRSPKATEALMGPRHTDPMQRLRAALGELDFSTILRNQWDAYSDARADLDRRMAELQTQADELDRIEQQIRDEAKARNVELPG